MPYKGFVMCRTRAAHVAPERLRTVCFPARRIGPLRRATLRQNDPTRHHNEGAHAPPTSSTMSARALALVLFTIACKGAEDAGAKTASATPEAAAPASANAPAEADAANDPLVAKADSARIRGNPAAKVWMIIASDFQCPYCKMWHDSADMIIRREYVDNGKVRLAFVNFPIGTHQHALPAAEYAMCASAQNKFWEMHDAIFSVQAKWAAEPDPTTTFEQLASSVGADMA